MRSKQWLPANRDTRGRRGIFLSESKRRYRHVNRSSATKHMAHAFCLGAPFCISSRGNDDPLGYAIKCQSLPSARLVGSVRISPLHVSGCLGKTTQPQHLGVTHERTDLRVQSLLVPFAQMNADHLGTSDGLQHREWFAQIGPSAAPHVSVPKVERLAGADFERFFHPLCRHSTGRY